MVLRSAEQTIDSELTSILKNTYKDLSAGYNALE